MINIFIADDHVLIREGLKKILKDEFDLKVVGEAEDSFGIFDKLKKSKCDLLLLDLNMPGRSGIELIEELKQSFPKLSILVLSMYPEDKFAIRALKAGASGYITKDKALTELVKAIRKINSNGRYISESLALQIAFDFDNDAQKPLHENLSNREIQVMCMIASNKNIKEIASELSLSVSTINTYRARILEKMKMKTDIELTHYAIENNLIDLVKHGD